MFSWLGTDDRRKKEPEVFQTVSDGLKKLYKTKLLPLEESYKFHEFHSPALEDADFDNKPMVLLVGQYSTGKTSFIRWENCTCVFIYTWNELHVEIKVAHTERHETQAARKINKGSGRHTQADVLVHKKHSEQYEKIKSSAFKAPHLIKLY